MARTKRERSVQPDLVLRIHHRKKGGNHRLQAMLEVRNRYLGLELGDETFPSIKIEGSLEAFLPGYFKDIQGQELKTEEDRALARMRLASLGVRIGEHLMPEGLRQRLWSLRRHKPAPNLLLLSNETWIPWELIRLRDLDAAEPAFAMAADAAAADESEEDASQSRYLVEIFAFSRWLHNRGQRLELPLRKLGLIIPDDSRLDSAASEKQHLLGLFPTAEDLPVKTVALLSSLATTTCDALHFTGHGIAYPEDPDRGGIRLQGNDRLRPGDLADEARNLRRTQPWVFFNACDSARGLFALNGLGGFADAFLRGGAGAFIGTYWQVPDTRAGRFALAVYEYFLEGLPLGEAVRTARVWFSKRYPGDPTFLAYTVYGHPLAVRDEAAVRWSVGESLPLAIPSQPWTAQNDHPAGLLRAEYGVVPFHSRDREREELDAWCGEERQLAVRLLAGAGGMGKTRLLLEVAKQRQEEGWLAGFFTMGDADRAPTEAWDALAACDKPLFLVTDYAETRRDLLVPIIRGMRDAKEGGYGHPVRLVLLARAALDWWEQLKSEGEGVGDFLQGPATSHFSLQPLAFEPEDRIDSYWIAAKRFSEVLGKPRPSSDPGTFEEEIFERVLFLHMAALAAVQGVDVADRDGILDYVLRRERRFWQRLAKDRGLPKGIVRGIGRAMAALTLGGGAKTQLEAISAFQELKFFVAKDPQLLEDVARLLHDCYPGDKQFIAPLQPDLLGEHLIHRELQRGADELLDLVFR